MLNQQDSPRPVLRDLLSALRSDAAVAFLALLFFILPLYRTGILEDSFNTPKVALAQALCLCALASIMARRWFSHDDDRNRPLADNMTVGTLLTIFLGAQVLTMLHARSSALAMGALVCWCTFILVYWICLGALRDSHDVALIFTCGIASAAVTSGWTIIEDFTCGSGVLVARLPDWRGYLAAGLGNSGHIAGFIGLFLPAALIIFLAARRFRPLIFVPIFLMFVALVVTWSVGSAGATLVSLAVWAMIAWRCGLAGELHWQRVAWLVLAGILAIAFYFIPHPLNPHAPSLFSEAFASRRWAEGWPTRVVIWKTAWHMIATHPLLGIGSGNFTLEYVRQIVPSVLGDPRLRPYAGSFTNEAHNEFLQIWCEGGLPAIAIFLALLAAWFVRLQRLLHTITIPANRLFLIASGAGVTTLVFDSLMTFPLRLPAHLAALMFLLAAPEIIARHADASKWRVRTPFWSMLMALCLACFWWQAHRVMAERHLKRGRLAAESVYIMNRGVPEPLWHEAESLFAEGSRLLASGDTKRAMGAFAAAKTAASSDELKEAETEFLRALAWDSRYSNASSRLGALLLMRGESAEALRILSDMTLRDLESPEIYERIGFASYLTGDKKRAARAWQTCLSRRPALADYYAALVKMAQQ
ncbi:MAG: O-antigen ligase family protein [bacterium]